MARETDRQLVPDEAARRATTAAQEEAAPSADAAPSKRLSVKQKIAVTAVGALSIALIAVSSVFLLMPESQQPTQAADSAQVGQANQQDAASAEAASGKAADKEASAGGTAGDGNAAAPEAQSQDQAPAGVAAASLADNAPAQAESTSSATPSPEAQQSAQQTVTVSVAVDSSAVGGAVSGGASPTFAPGATAYDALCACGLSVNASQSQFGVYVSAIGGLAEKEYGGQSGWKYSVNGVVPSVSCSAYVLQDGDHVQWFYATTA